MLDDIRELEINGFEVRNDGVTQPHAQGNLKKNIRSTA